MQVFWGLDKGVRWDITFTAVVSYKDKEVVHEIQSLNSIKTGITKIARKMFATMV